MHETVILDSITSYSWSNIARDCNRCVLATLVEELRELWDVGVEAYDASSKNVFQLRAALMWTVHDFPAYADVSGWSTKGKTACPCCASETDSQYLKHGHKFCCMGHRRWLDSDHEFQDEDTLFNGSTNM